MRFFAATKEGKTALDGDIVLSCANATSLFAAAIKSDDEFDDDDVGLLRRKPDHARDFGTTSI